MNLNESTYGTRANGLGHGVVYTRKEVVCAMLDLVKYTPQENLSTVRILEPAAGEGAFVEEILHRLIQSATLYKFNLEETLPNIRFVELEETTAQQLRDRVQHILAPELGDEKSQNWARQIVLASDFLATNSHGFDIIIGNPPYVRHEQIPSGQKEEYKKQFHTFRYRSDLYIPFFEHGLKQLALGGALCFICSNRWLKNQYGAPLRQFITQHFALRCIIDLGKTQPFEEAVIAYPAITLIENSLEKKTIQVFHLQNLEELPKIISGNRTSDRSIGRLNGQDWSIHFVNLSHSFSKLDYIENQGFKIGIGVATGADKVFIRKDFVKRVEKEVILPIIMPRDLRNDHFEWQGNYVINPFDPSGDLVDLSRFPRLQEYFQQHRSKLEKRHIAVKKPAYWYRTIDKIYPNLVDQPKILLPDISGNRIIFIDEGRFYPHHNIYYITGPDLKRLQILAALLMSDFTRDQLTQLGNQMNGGYPRWQSQNLRKLQLPIIDWLADDIRKGLIQAYKKQDTVKINQLIKEAANSNYAQQSGQIEIRW